MKKLRRFAAGAWNIFRHRYLSLAFRFGLGITFIVAAVGKLGNGSAFVDEVVEYHLLPDTMSQIYGTALPWVEIIIGALLLVGLASRFASGIAVLTSLSLLIANGVVLYRGINQACGCFGDLAALQTRDAIVIDFVLLIMAIQILIRKGDFFSLDSIISRRKSSEPSSG